MIRNGNFAGIFDPANLGLLAGFTIPAVVRVPWAPQPVRLLDLDPEDPQYAGRWIVSVGGDRAWRLRRVILRNAAGEVVVRQYIAGRQQWVDDPLPPDETLVTDFRVTDLPELHDHRFADCNFTQPQAVNVGGQWRGRRLFPGDDTPRHFFGIDRGVNLVNCELPPGSTVTGRANTTIKERNVPLGPAVLVDGQVVARYRGDVIHGRLDPSTLSYDYKPAPEVIELEVR